MSEDAHLTHHEEEVDVEVTAGLEIEEISTTIGTIHLVLVVTALGLTIDRRMLIIKLSGVRGALDLPIVMIISPKIRAGSTAIIEIGVAGAMEIVVDTRIRIVMRTDIRTEIAETEIVMKPETGRNVMRAEIEANIDHLLE